MFDLVINYDKTIFIKFSIIKCSNYDCPLLIHNSIKYSNFNLKIYKQIKEISYIRYLGIILDISLRKILHINNLVKKLHYIYLNSLNRFVTSPKNMHYLFYVLSIYFFNMVSWYKVVFKIIFKNIENKSKQYVKNNFKLKIIRKFNETKL